MPQIDEKAINEKKVLDLNNPPMTNLAYQPFPKLVYLHPKDKTQEHKFKQVANEAELAAAQKLGYKLKPHVPTVPADVADARFDTADGATK